MSDDRQRIMYSRHLTTGQVQKRDERYQWPPVDDIDEEHQAVCAMLELVENIMHVPKEIPGVGAVWLWEGDTGNEHVMEVYDEN